MYQELKVGDRVNFNIPEIFRSCLPMKTKEMIAEIYKNECTVERVDPDTGYVYVNNPWAKAQGLVIAHVD